MDVNGSLETSMEPVQSMGINIKEIIKAKDLEYEKKTESGIEKEI